MAHVTVGVVSAGGTEGGPARNADNYLLGVDGLVTWRDGERETSEHGGGAGTLLAVCDGLGREAAVASQSTVRVMAKLYRPGLPKDPARAMLQYVQRAHDRLHGRARRDGPVALGASLTLAWIVDGAVHWVQVGNSRLYLVRGKRITRITPEHTRSEFSHRDGITVPDEPAALAQAFLYGSRGLGNDAVLRLEPGLDAGSEPLEPGDRLVLCTVGVWRTVDPVSMVDVLRHVDQPQAAAVHLVERARARGSSDDATAIVCRVDRVPAHTDPDEPVIPRPTTGHTFPG